MYQPSPFALFQNLPSDADKTQKETADSQKFLSGLWEVQILHTGEWKS